MLSRCLDWMYIRLIYYFTIKVASHTTLTLGKLIVIPLSVDRSVVELAVVESSGESRDESSLSIAHMSMA